MRQVIVIGVLFVKATGVIFMGVFLIHAVKTYQSMHHQAHETVHEKKKRRENKGNMHELF